MTVNKEIHRWRKVFVLVPDHLAAVYAIQYWKVLLLDVSKDESRFRPERITSRRLIGSEPFPSSRVHHGLCSYSTELIPQLVTIFSSSFYVVLTYRRAVSSPGVAGGYFAIMDAKE